ncbi:MAG: bacterioferritin [Acidobacteriota bacterium]|nr:bacterioferritin [Acidobacteriota bacterium]MDQ5871718.1 bacterioferritin [Acidobacteriota bacterium]
MEANFDKKSVVDVLNRILETELAGVVRYTHYSFMVFGYTRIPIVAWLREQATESIGHAQQAGEMITLLGEHPSLSIGKLLETHRHDVGDILREALENEKAGLALYRKLHELVAGRDVLLEEYARQLITQEQMHVAEVDKMLRQPGDVAAFSSEKKVTRSRRRS